MKLAESSLATAEIFLSKPHNFKTWRTGDGTEGLSSQKSSEVRGAVSPQKH